jgi:poly-gamma-glutamate capsule biosynthesis protein CapA/YwtB (metallophosphatase superfamily)
VQNTKAHYIFWYLVSLPVLAFGQLSDSIPDSTSITLLFAGDIMGHGPQINAAFDSNTGKYNYDNTFAFVRPYIQQADLAIANLEVTLAGPPYSGYPQFSSPDTLAYALKNAGFDVLITANNHAADRGGEGIERTLDQLDLTPIMHTGTFRNQAERDSLYPLLIVDKGFRIALLNYTYGTNGIVVPSPWLVNNIDTLKILSDLASARSMNPDIIISTLHWGNEYERVPNQQQRQLAAFLFRNGSRLIIGSHPHVIQPAEFVYPDSTDSTKRDLVLYSLGNYVSNQRDRYKNGGIMFKVSLTKRDSTILIADAAYLPVWVYKQTAGKVGYYILTPLIATEMEEKGLLPSQDKINMDEFFKDTRSHMGNIREIDKKKP